MHELRHLRAQSGAEGGALAELRAARERIANPPRPSFTAVSLVPRLNRDAPFSTSAWRGTGLRWELPL